MWTMEDVLSELSDDQGEGNSYNNNSKKGRNNNNNNNNNGLPPGFRFHPTDEELITFYLASKVFHSHNLSPPVHIAEVDLNRCEPWDLPERAKMGEKEWYLYSLRDRKYPTGLRTNRATSTGYWKATGKDRQIHSSGSMGSNNTTGGTGHHGSSSSSGMLIGMKKTLVFYQGRAPRGVKTRWVMHEYRLDGHFSSFRLSSRDEWVICRIFMKNNGGEKRTGFYPLAPPPESPLSPFLRHLPPLLDVPVTATASSTSSTTKAPPLNSSTTKSEHQFPIHHHNDSNFLLQSLLSNPLPNFSSLTDEPNPLMFNTYHSAAAAAATSIDHLKSFCNPLPYPKHLPTTTVTAAGVNVQKQNRNLEQYYQNCMGRISQSSKQSNYDQFSVHDDGDYDDGEEEEEEEDEQDDNDDPSTVGFDMSTSAAALNRLLNPHHFNNFPAESWHFQL